MSAEVLDDLMAALSVEMLALSSAQQFDETSVGKLETLD